MSSANDARGAISAENDSVALTQITDRSGQRDRYMPSESNTCCRKNKHGDEHTLLPLTLVWQRRPIVCGEGQEEAVINAQISASPAKHSAMSLTDDAASLSPPFCFVFFYSQIWTR